MILYFFFGLHSVQFPQTDQQTLLFISQNNMLPCFQDQRSKKKLRPAISVPSSTQRGTAADSFPLDQISAFSFPLDQIQEDSFHLDQISEDSSIL